MNSGYSRNPSEVRCGGGDVREERQVCDQDPAQPFTRVHLYLSGTGFPFMVYSFICLPEFLLYENLKDLKNTADTLS